MKTSSALAGISRMGSELEGGRVRSSCIMIPTGTLTSRDRILTKFVVCIGRGYKNDWLVF